MIENNNNVFYSIDNLFECIYINIKKRYLYNIKLIITYNKSI